MNNLPMKNEAGVFMTMVSAGTNLTEKTIELPLGVARMVRDEAFRATYAGVDWLEGLDRSTFEIARQMWNA